MYYKNKVYIIDLVMAKPNSYIGRHEEHSIVNAILTFENIQNISTFNILLKFATA